MVFYFLKRAKPYLSITEKKCNFLYEVISPRAFYLLMPKTEFYIFDAYFLKDVINSTLLFASFSKDTSRVLQHLSCAAGWPVLGAEF
jgi:hypothetical protein